ncbi:MAG: hypothetical protein LBD27_04000 [Tannerella sp.]|nr:hypothetical protein [Tannerella sp.]
MKTNSRNEFENPPVRVETNPLRMGMCSMYVGIRPFSFVRRKTASFRRSMVLTLNL